jgi:outer membrane protein OmpA-like peptidoglycan-associated protein
MRDKVQLIKIPGILCILVLAAPAAGEVLKGHTLIPGYPGSTLTVSDARGFSEFKIVTEIRSQGKTDDEKLPNLTVAGELTRLSYENPKDRSILEIFTNYKEALEKAGFRVLAQCADAGCAPVHHLIGRINGTKFTSAEMRFLTARIKQGGKETYVQINIIKHRHEIYIIERTAMERGLVVVTYEAIQKGLSADGRVVLDGVLFDVDKATLKPESKPALDTIAKFLSDNPSLKVYIVGHTDGTGKLANNIQLSRNRAAAVVAALISEYKIAGIRLSAHGVGPLSPAGTNKSDTGRALNRRVEMVEM